MLKIEDLLKLREHVENIPLSFCSDRMQRETLRRVHMVSNKDAKENDKMADREEFI